MLDVYFEKHVDHSKVIKDRRLYIDQPERINFIYSIDGIPEDETGSYQEASNRALKHFLMRLNRFPLFVTFGGDLINENIEPFFQKENLLYTKIQPDKSSPYYSLQLNDTSKLERLLDETYWYAAENNFYFLSFTNLLTFERRMVKGWFFKKERTVPVIRVKKEMSFITMEHDFMGYYLFSNEPCFNTEDKVKAIFPDDGTIEFY